MFSAWNFVEWIQSLLSIAFIVSVSAGLSVLFSKVVVRCLRDEPAAIIPFPASHRESTSLLRKAA